MLKNPSRIRSRTICSTQEHRKQWTIIDSLKRRRQARRAELSMERLDKIIKWLVEMRKRGLMPDNVTKAFNELAFRWPI
jgi:hypothetical protein